MRHDLYYGAIISLGIHFGLASLNPARTERPVVLKSPDGPRIEITMPPDDPPDNSRNGDAGEKTSKPDLQSPPQLPDNPKPAVRGDFVMQSRPPVIAGVETKTPVFTLPSGTPSGDNGDGKIFDLTALDQQPVAKFQAKPVYPFAMKRSGESGEVVVDFIVDQNGDVRNTYAVKSTNREFEQAAVQAVSKWKFRPGKKAGHAVGTHMQVPIVFHLGQEGE